MAQVPTYPKTLNIYNLKYFFNFKPIGANQILPGSIVQFNYRSPEGIHDKSPLIYVLETEQDRVWGINLHYKLSLLGGIVELKKAEVLKATPQTVQPIPVPTPGDSKVKPEQLNQKFIPSLPEFKETLGVGKGETPTKKVTLPPQLLEHYTLTSQPKELLRNYLYSRISNTQKLVFKTL